MCAISSLMCSDLLSLDHIFAVTRQRLQQLGRGSPGPVANRATKVTPGVSPGPLPAAGGSRRLPEPSPRPGVALPPTIPLSSQMLRQFEALCRGRRSPESVGTGSDPSALAAGSAPCTRDLLTDIAPPAGESILTPLPAAVPARGEERGLEAESHGQPAAAVPACRCELGVASGLGGDTAGTPAPGRSLSLFAGMELVACSGAVLCPDAPAAEPRTLSQPQDGRTDTEGARQPSAFAFLNV